MAYETVQLHIEDRIARITLNRPERLNALSAQLTQELGDAVEEVAATTEDVRCLILTGAGRAFCAGGDTGGMAGGNQQREARSAEGIRRSFRGAQRAVLGLHRLEIPTIAMVNGDAVGAGFDLACVCDLRTMASTARFMVAYRRIGLIPGWGGAWLYPRRLGLSKAAELMFTGDFLSAAEAQQYGFISAVAPVDELEAMTMELANKIASGPPISLRLMKQLLYKGMQMDLETAMQMAATGSSITLSSEDHREGVAAMREKRAAAYVGR
ncbi:MAG: enoyl-CoA hydratase/isomerase family protein [Dehalococcoidia bacterium]